MDEARAMLDELMGKTRDLTEDIKKNVRQTHFSDDEVCKDYLCGVCPHLLFTTTKSDLGKCPKPICGEYSMACSVHCPHFVNLIG